MNIPVFPEARIALKGKKGLIVGIANDQSIAWGCAKAFPLASGADLTITYLNDKAKKHVEPLAQQLEAPIVMPTSTWSGGWPNWAGSGTCPTCGSGIVRGAACWPRSTVGGC